MARVVFDIKGMDCADEAILLRRTLGDVAGVDEVTPNVVERSLAVVFRETETSSAKIVEAIEKPECRASVRTGEADTSESSSIRSPLGAAPGSARGPGCGGFLIGARVSRESHWLGGSTSSNGGDEHVRRC
jgi:cation transport ATPase